MRFWKRKRPSDTPSESDSRWPHILGRFRQTGSDLMVVVGPEDGASVCTDWVGAVVSVSGKHPDFPALVDAVSDGLFHPGCRHILRPYDPAEDEAEGLFCTRLAAAAMHRRREHRAAGKNPDEAEVNARGLEFKRLYDHARALEQAGDAQRALFYCQAR